MLMSGQYFYTAFIGREWPNVPYLQRVIHSVGKYVRSIRAKTQSGNGVGVSLQFVKHCIFSKIPYFYIIIDTAADYLFRCVVECYCSDLQLYQLYKIVYIHILL